MECGGGALEKDACLYRHAPVAFYHRRRQRAARLGFMGRKSVYSRRETKDEYAQ